MSTTPIGQQTHNTNTILFTDWISEQAWDNITELDKVAGFHGIIDSFEQNPKLWQSMYPNIVFVFNSINLKKKKL